MGTYTVAGTYEDRAGDRSFETAIDAPNEEVATERAYATMGSRHGLKRTEMTVDSVEEAAQ
ncbi:MAG: 50S ribosomal protein L18Ae [Halococcoides sp.]